MTESADSASIHRTTSPAPGYIFGTVLALLPVFFVGMVSPLSLLSRRALCSARQPLPASNPPGLFQRPPPAWLA